MIGSKPLRLLFVTKHLEGQGGGAERVLSLVASNLAERGHKVSIATFDPPKARDFYSIDPRVSRKRLGVGDAMSKSGPVDFVRHVAALRNLLRMSKPDVAIGFMHSSFVPLGIAAIGTHIPIIASEHTAYDHYRAYGFQGALIRITASFFSAFTATSDRVRAGFPQSIRRRMAVIPNPVSFPDTDPRNTFPQNRVLLSVGGLRKEKGHDTLIAAFARLAERFPDWALRIVGDGPSRAGLEQQVITAGLHRRVTFAGAVGDVAPEYAAASLFVIPSTYESFGLATAEALAVGIPAVGFADCPGTNEIIQHGVNGLLVWGEDRVEALAAGLAKLMVDDEMRTGLARAAPKTVAQYSLDGIADRWEVLLSRIARRREGDS